MSLRLVIAVLASLVAHAAAVFLLLFPHPTPPNSEPFATVALVQTASQFVGGAPQLDAQDAAPEQSPPQAPPADMAQQVPILSEPPTPPAQAVVEETHQNTRPPRPPAKVMPSPPSFALLSKSPQPSGKPAVPAQDFAIRLQEDSAPGLGKFLENENVTPASLDESYKNLPPVYPAEARRRGIQGTVGLTIRIAVDGTPLDIAIATSSGSAELDNAARQAVRRWHFRPEFRGGQPAESQFSMDVHFQLKAGAQ